MYQCLFCQSADAQSCGELGAVGKCHWLRSIVGIEAVTWLALLAGPAFAADSAPVQYDGVANFDVGNFAADGFDDRSSFVAQQEWVSIFNIAIAVSQIGMADTTSFYGNNDIMCAGSGDDNVDGLDFCTLRTRNDALHGLLGLASRGVVLVFYKSFTMCHANNLTCVCCSVTNRNLPHPFGAASNPPGLQSVTNYH